MKKMMTWKRLFAAVLTILLMVTVVLPEFRSEAASGDGWKVVDSRWIDEGLGSDLENKNGECVHGYQKNGKLLKSCWSKINGRYYYFDKYGIAADNFHNGIKVGNSSLDVDQELKYKWYNVQGSTNQYMYKALSVPSKQGFCGYNYPTSGVVRIDGKAYYFGTDHKTKKPGWFKTYDPKHVRETIWYYVNKDGTLATGWKKIGSKYYFFDYYTGVLCHEDFEDKNSNAPAKYFLCDTSVPGAKKRVGYLFNADGVCIEKQGWYKLKIDLEDEWVYVNQGGTLPKGWKKISGKWYYFYDADSEIGGVMVHGISTGTEMCIFADGYRIGAQGQTVGSGYAWHRSGSKWWYGKGSFYVHGTNGRTTFAVIDSVYYEFDSNGYLISK